MFVSLMIDSFDSTFRKSKQFILSKQIFFVFFVFFHLKHGERCLSTLGFCFYFFCTYLTVCVFI